MSSQDGKRVTGAELEPLSRWIDETLSYDGPANLRERRATRRH